jgi:H+/Na+-translocating ferredoxin:NAD+ oxidoreductase subunit B
MITAIASLALLASVAGLLLGYASIRFRVEGDPIADQIDALLPQTQCGQCGFAGCRPYAEAIASGEAEINKCAPGGGATALALADLLGRDPGTADGVAQKAPARAVIDEAECIGCTLCLQACPVDAILGAAKHMHQVIASECTGCELCLKPCPVECIHMVAIPEDLRTWKWPFPDSARPAIVRGAAAAA